MPSCTSFYTIESWRLKRLGAGPGRLWHVRLQIHLALASIPVLAISAHVFTSLSLRTVAFAVLLPLAVALATFVTRRPDRSDQVLLAGFIWGVVACAGYDAFRLPTIYACHWWSDFFGPVGGWATGTRSSFLVGYLWRYVGDGGGIAVAFFALAATLRAGRWQNRTVLAFAVSYAVFPVWTGLVLTDALASHPHQLFPLSLTTLILSLVGHLIYGALLGLGYCHTRSLEALWPIHLRLSRAHPADSHDVAPERSLAHSPAPSTSAA